ncbi:hypothetical protein DFH07DRAFT_835820 [Mycena maculata]|uniref:Uncharacterized protein n=1 Tax=Mycena maculata TaxID=230809 RepID=A0AAD7IJ39_9AGAR|nr:hypothetical protein DFH07DRAFT_835820 [Mycena maculata]
MSPSVSDSEGPGSTAPALVQATHHPAFYFKDGSAIFSLKTISEGGGESAVLYKLHSSVPCSRSTFFASMFALPRGPASSSQVRMEGLVDENPIHLPSDFIKH